MRGEKYEPVSPVCYWFYGSILLCITDQKNNQVKVQFNNKLQPFINVSAGEFINKKENRFITYEKKFWFNFVSPIILEGIKIKNGMFLELKRIKV